MNALHGYLLEVTEVTWDVLSVTVPMLSYFHNIKSCSSGYLTKCYPFTGFDGSKYCTVLFFFHVELFAFCYIGRSVIIRIGNCLLLLDEERQYVRNLPAEMVFRQDE